MGEKSALAHFLMVYFFPLQLATGLVGNAFNLVVLLDRHMRSRTSTLLAAVAFADILFLLFMVPHTFLYNRYLRGIGSLRIVLRYGSPHLTALVNMCACASTWFLVAVCFERLLAVRWPLRARTFWGKKSRPSRTILMICLLSLLVTMHTHFTHRMVEVEVQGRTMLRTVVRPSMEGYWRMATVVQAVLQVFIPVFLVTATSLLMADALFSFLPPLRRTKQGGLTLLHSGATLSLPSIAGKGTTPQKCTELLNDSAIARNSMADAGKSSRNACQRRATFVVLIIAVAFALFHLPSTLIYIWELADIEAPTSPTFITLGTLANSLVVSANGVRNPKPHSTQQRCNGYPAKEEHTGSTHYTHLRKSLSIEVAALQSQEIAAKQDSNARNETAVRRGKMST